MRPRDDKGQSAPVLSCFASTTPCVECTWRRARSVRVHVSRRAHGMNEEGRGGKKREPRGLPLVPDSHGRELLTWQEDKRQGHSDASARMAPRRTPPPFWWRFPVLSPLLSPLLFFEVSKASASPFRFCRVPLLLPFHPPPPPPRPLLLHARRSHLPRQLHTPRGAVTTWTERAHGRADTSSRARTDLAVWSTQAGLVS